MSSLRWKWRTPTFARLMLGRIELAQISKGAASGDWFWTLRFTEAGERPCFSAPTEDEARRICEEHARKVLA
jgi:hypothetical protein